MLHLTFSGHVTPADKARSDYLYVPFDLPAAARRLTIRYDYSARMHHGQVHGGNVIDIGLFDPRGNHFPGASGFRGWSGSDRQTFTLALHEATPGYLPGPLPAGRYQVALGLYRIWPQGADYEIDVRADLLEDGAQPAAPAPTNASDTDVSDTDVSDTDVSDTDVSDTVWLKGDLQSHTFHSDGKGSPQQLVEKARALDLDFLAITDHNTVSHHPTLARLSDERLLLIRGQEVTTYYGHMNVWGTGRWCDFRAAGSDEMAAIIDLAHEHGALCSINHPKEGGPPWTYDVELPVDTMEVWQGPWPNRNDESLALWDRLLREGRRLPAVGGSDYHCPAAEETGFLRLGQPTTWVKATGRSTGAILAALRAGRCSISASPHGPRLDLHVATPAGPVHMGQRVAPQEAPFRVMVEVVRGQGLALHLVTENGVVHERPLHDEQETVTVEIAASRYIRAELVGDMPAERLPPNAPSDLDLRHWRWALSNPVYIDLMR